MLWLIPIAIPAAALMIAVILLAVRRHEAARLAQTARDRRDAISKGSHKARLQHPYIDLSRCIGCGLCVSACPEEQVLDLLHGQAVIVHGSRCVGHGRCAEACPVGAIALTLGDVSERDDLPALDANFEAVGSPGLFLAGEVTGYALVRTAIQHGTQVADEIATRCARASSTSRNPDDPIDLLIVGAGPAGIACSLRAKERHLRFLTIDQDTLGGTVARYPRRKLVMTQPVVLPLYGKVQQTTFVKEDLIALWHEVVEKHQLPIKTGVAFRGLTRNEQGVFEVETSHGKVRARYVCLAIGRRGSPRKLGVPGEERENVAYSLLDAKSYTDRKVLVVGGGDSAIEAAVGLAEQPGNRVTLSYRRAQFTRIKSRNERRLHEVTGTAQLELLLNSEVTRIDDSEVELAVEGSPDSQCTRRPVDDVFVFAGGIPPFQLLESAGVSFAPEDRVPVDSVGERGPGLLLALVGAFAASLVILTWAALYRGYYGVDLAARVTLEHHEWLRPSGPLGLTCGALAIAAMIWNLAYLVRRAPWGQWIPGALSFWMASHVLTGIVALLLVFVHAGFTTRASVGGHALIAMTIVVIAGAIGRYLYSFVPRATNGRELALDEVRVELEGLSAEWDQRGSDFGARVRAEIEAIVDRDRWQRSFFGRVMALLTSQRRVAKLLSRLRGEGRAAGYTDEELDRWIPLAERAHRIALAASHYEDLRAILGTWRYIHRWLALFLVLVVIAHIVAAVRYADFGWLARWWEGR
ncbi:MAG: NAD(P)-binding domain-containing protein [Planctomycetes bacterium]|nr:NAD(P)-binding domain-containing protein [Planctomycetota bacterium]